MSSTLENKKTIIKDEITMYGITEGEDSCHNCVSLDKIVKSKIESSPEVPIEYKHYNVLTDEIGKQVAKEKKIKDIPYVQHCKITEDNDKKCDTIVGYDENDWKNIGKKRVLE